MFFFFSSRRRHTRCSRDWSSDVCSSDLYATEAGLDAASFKSCMAGPEAAATVNASHANGEKLEVNSTPTVFVNGRRMVGADTPLLEQYINYELAKLNTSKSTEQR